MKGFVKVESAQDGGLNCIVKMEDVSFNDRINILNAVVNGLQMAPLDLDIFMFLFQHGDLEKPKTRYGYEVGVDMDLLNKLFNKGDKNEQ